MIVNTTPQELEVGAVVALSLPSGHTPAQADRRCLLVIDAEVNDDPTRYGIPGGHLIRGVEGTVTAIEPGTTISGGPCYEIAVDIEGERFDFGVHPDRHVRQIVAD